MKINFPTSAAVPWAWGGRVPVPSRLQRSICFLPSEKCPSNRARCEMKERDQCTKHRQCPNKMNCCKFACGKKCLNIKQGNSNPRNYLMPTSLPPLSATCTAESDQEPGCIFYSTHLLWVLGWGGCRETCLFHFCLWVWDAHNTVFPLRALTPVTCKKDMGIRPYGYPSVIL